MAISRLIYAVIRKWWMVIIIVGLSGGIGYYMNVFSSHPTYSADTTLYIINKDKVASGLALSTQDLNVSQSLVKQYSGIFYSRTVTSAAAIKLAQYHIPQEALMSMVFISSQEDSNLLTIRASGSDPIIAAAVANAMGEEFTSTIRALTKSDYVGVLDQAVPPKTPMPNNGIKKTILWAFAGLIIALGSIYCIEYLDTTVRSLEDVEDNIKIKVIGIIPEHDIR
jgi:capsular polysaccharide biosynthesis protein